LQILPSGDLIGHSIPIVELVSLAYNVPDNPSPRLSTLPEWTARQRFDIEAKVPFSLKLDSKDVETQRRTIEPFVRKLLADRFGLVLKARTERMPVYALSVAKGDPKLSSAAITSGGCILDTSPEGCHSFAPGFGHPLNARAVDMSDLAHYLENWTDLPVVNRTELTGLFAMQSQGWKPMKLPPPPPGTSASGDEFASLPPLSTVLSTFGLQLRRREESLPFYTVERIHQPNTRS
jgi:uncharacterized protein (TIGR03435 family)